MSRKVQILSLFTAFAMFVFSACAPPPASPGAVTSAPEIVAATETQSPTTPTPAETETPVRLATETPTPEPVLPTPAIEAAVCTEPVELTTTDETITYKNVQFKVYQSLGLKFTVQECGVGIIEEGWMPYYPAHMVFKASSSLPNNVIQPEIRVFEIPEDRQLYTYPINSLSELKQILDERPEPSPWYQGAALHTGEKYLDSHYGIGVRAVVEYYQDIFFWTNNYLQFIYNGLTDDGSYFISASFPVRAPFLMDIEGSDPSSNTNPDAIPIPSWPGTYEAQGKVVEEYNREVLHRFESASLADLSPEIGVYDFTMESLQVGVPNPAPTTSEPACFATLPDTVVPFTFRSDSTSLLVRGNSWVQIFNLETLKEASLLQAPKQVMAAALSPDGKTLAWALEDHAIQLLRIEDQTVLHTLTGHTDMVTKLRFSPDGNLLVSASHDYSARVWDMQGEELRSFQPPGEVLGIAISPDGSTLAIVPFDGPVALWDLETLEKVKDLGGSGGYDTSDPYFSPDGKLLAADLATGLSLWRISDGELIWNENINSMAATFSPDGRYLAYSDISDNHKIFLSTPDGVEIVRSLEGHQSPVWEIFFSPDSRLLASYDGIELRVWNAEDGSLKYIGKVACP